MAKRIILVLCSIFVSMLNVYSLSSADQNNTPVDIDKSSIVETVVDEEQKPETTVGTTATTTKKSTQTTTQTAQKASVTQVDTITILGKTNWVENVTSTTDVKSDHVSRYQYKNSKGLFYFGHNSSNVFGNLVNAKEGQTFSTTTNGVTTNYVISKIVIFEKSGNSIFFGGEDRYNGSSYMTGVAKAKFQGKQYNISIMTCHGKSLGGGDATERLVVFANKI